VRALQQELALAVCTPHRCDILWVTLCMPLMSPLSAAAMSLQTHHGIAGFDASEHLSRSVCCVAAIRWCSIFCTLKAALRAVSNSFDTHLASVHGSLLRFVAVATLFMYSGSERDVSQHLLSA
jgi:hypothetical protein